MPVTTLEPGTDELARNANNFRHHAPHGDQAARYAEVRSMLEDVANALLRRCPRSRELSVALTKLEEVMFWANASIARNERQRPATEKGGPTDAR